jgi:hypothetical protein
LYKPELSIENKQMSYFQLKRYKHKKANNVEPTINENRKKVCLSKNQIQIPYNIMIRTFLLSKKD